MVAALFLLLAASTPGSTSDFASRILSIEERTGARIGVAALDTGSGKRLDYRSKERFPVCSTFKFLAAAAVLKRVDEKQDQLGRFIRYDAKDILEYAPVTKAHLKDGGMTLGALCAAAIEQSDNTAGNLLLDAIGGPAGLTNFVRSVGDEMTRLDRKEPELNSAIPGDERDTTSPAGMCADMQRLLLGNVLSESSRRQLEDWLRHNETGALMIRAGVPKTWTIGDKTGRGANGATNDVAIVRPPGRAPILIAIYSIGSTSSADDRAATVAEAARVIVEFLSKSGNGFSAVTLWDGIRCLNFADARLAALDLAIAHENFELPHRSSSYRNCRLSAACSKRRRSGSRARYSRFARKLSVPALPAVGAAWRARHSVSVRGDSVWSPVFRDRPDLCSRP
jgi:beta-lactamase class A